MRILQVEDDSSAAQSIEKMLASKGHKCDTTAYGEDAVTRAMTGAYDLILLDIILPDIDGYEVLRRLGQAGVNTPVVIQTGIVSRNHVDKAASLGTKYYLLKPFSKDELSSCIDAAIAGDKAATMALAQSTKPIDRRDDFRDPGASRRAMPRIRTLKSAQIVYNNHTCVADCSVINTSEGGAALQLRDFVEYPPRFQLKVHRGATYNCEVCWQSGNKIGVRFLQE